jgi:hypothetical protein
MRLVKAEPVTSTELGLLIVGDCYGIRSNAGCARKLIWTLAYRWFCRLGLALTWTSVGPLRETQSGPSVA